MRLDVGLELKPDTEGDSWGTPDDLFRAYDWEFGFTTSHGSVLAACGIGCAGKTRSQSKPGATNDRYILGQPVVQLRPCPPRPPGDRLQSLRRDTDSLPNVQARGR